MCKDLNESLPVQTLPFEMFCVCGYSDTDGNTLARHLAICEKKSAYPSSKKADAAIARNSMLDVLGLVRRPEEPANTNGEDEIDLKGEVDEDTRKKDAKRWVDILTDCYSDSSHFCEQKKLWQFYYTKHLYCKQI